MGKIEMALHFRDPDDPTKYQDMHDQICVSFSQRRKTQDGAQNTNCRSQR